MRTDLTLRSADGGEHDVAVLAPAGTRWAAVQPLLAAAPLSSLSPELAADTPLGHGGVLSGQSFDLAQSLRPPLAATHCLDVLCGPDAGHGLPLGQRPLTVGRAAECDLVLRDPDVSRVHAEFALTAHGPTVRDRGSSNGTSVDGIGVGPDAIPIASDGYVRLGDTFLGVSAAAGPAALTRAGPDGTVLVNRPPSSHERQAQAEFTIPATPVRDRPQRVQWLAALLPAAAAVAITVAMHAPQFLMFALLSPVAMLATSLGDRVHWRRERRRRHAQYRRDVAAARRAIGRALATERRARRGRDPGPSALLRTARLPGSRLWERRGGDADALRVRLGLGDLESTTRVRDGTELAPAGELHAVPVGVDLADGPLGLAGPRPVALGTARWVVGQLAVQLSPADVEFALLLSSEAEASWRWARWLPHLSGGVAVTPDERHALLAELADLHARRVARRNPDGRWPGRWVVVVLDRCGADLPGAGTLLSDGLRAGITALCVDGRRGGLPTACAQVAQVAGETGSRLRVTDAPAPVVADQVDAAWADAVARALAPLRDPTVTAADSVPAECRLLPLLGLREPTADGVLTRWKEQDRGLTTVLGVAADGPLALDLVRDGPHALVAGTTGAGKSELLRTLVAGLAASHPPESVAFVLVDYKGGAAFADCARLPHTAGVVTDLDSHLAARALRSLERELARREELFAESGARDLDEHRVRRPGEAMPRLVIVIDEFAELVADLDDFVPGLVGIARRGRSLGVHLVLATQRPSGVVSPEIRANTALRIALRVTDPAESRDVVDTDAAATIGKRQAGRAYLRLPGASAIVLQTARVGGTSDRDAHAVPRVVELDRWRRLPAELDAAGDAPTDLQLLVESAREAAARAGCAPPRSPWLDPLPDHVAISDIALDADTSLARDTGARIPIGLVDLPRTQQQRPLHVDLGAGGSLLLAGGPRSGRTSALLSLTIGAACALAPDRLQVYAIDAAGAGLAGLRSLPHLGSYVGSDVASASALISRLDAEVARRRSEQAQRPGYRQPLLLCLLDGWEAFSAAADQHDGGSTVESLLGMLRAAPSVGLTVAITGDRGALAVRLSSAVDTKLLLRLTDRADYALAGLAVRDVPSASPPGRAVRAGDGAEVQLAHLGADPSDEEQQRAIARTVTRWSSTPSRPGTGSRPPIRVRPLPDHVSLSSLSSLPRDPGRVTLGVGGDAAEPVTLDLDSGELRLLVAGPPRSGRSTVLACLLTQLPGCGRPVVIAAPPRSPLVALAAELRLPVVAPDDRDWRPPDGLIRPVLLIDDSESFLDTGAGDLLTEWVRTTVRGPAVVAAGSSDELAVCFRGVAAEVRRSRCAVLLHPGPGDGDLVGATIPRRRVLSPPGRGLLAGDRTWGRQFAAGPIPIQIAQP